MAESKKTVCRNKIDIHAHAYVTDFPDKKYIYIPDPEKLKEKYKELGVCHALLLPLTSPEKHKFICATADVRRIAENDPEHFSFAVGLDSRMITNRPDADFGPLLDFYTEKGAKGVGELMTNIPFDDPLTDNLLRQCAEHGLPVTIHISPFVGFEYGVVDEPGLPRLERMLKKHPDLKILGHSQAFWAHMSREVDSESMKGYPVGKVEPGRLWELMEKYPNLLCDLSARSGFNALHRDRKNAARFLNSYSDRIFFGCDICDLETPAPLSAFLDEMYLSGEITADVYLKVCRENAARLLRLRPEAN